MQWPSPHFRTKARDEAQRGHKPASGAFVALVIADAVTPPWTVEELDGGDKLIGRMDRCLSATPGKEN